MCMDASRIEGKERKKRLNALLKKMNHHSVLTAIV